MDSSENQDTETANKLSSFTDAQLEYELKRRKAPKKPPAQLEPHFAPLIQYICTKVVPYLEAKGKFPEDVNLLCFELAVEGIYGRNIWPWVRYIKDLHKSTR